MNGNRKMFSRDSAFFFYSEKIANLMILNLLVIFFSVPLLTFGAAMAAMHSVLLQILADEEGNVIVDFWRAFHSNFRKATGIWLIYVVIGTFLLLDYYLLRTGVLPEVNYLKWPVFIIVTVAFCSAMWSFVLQSRYENKVLATMRNGFVCTFVYLLKTIMMVLAATVPVFILIIDLKLMPIVLLLGISGPGLLQTMLYRLVFEQIENGLKNELEKNASNED